MRLLDALGRLSEAELDALAARWGVVIDPDKRLSPREQVARALVPHPALASLGEWAPELRVAAERLAAAPAGLGRKALGGAALKLLEARLAFSVPADDADADPPLVMPAAFRLGIPPSARDPAHAVRALLAGPLEDDVARAIAATHEVRQTAGPLALRLERALLHLEDPSWVARVAETLPADERRLLDGVDARGGVLPVADVLELEGASARYATSRGTVLPRRSTAFELVRRGFLLPDGPDALVVPSEVGAVVGAARREVSRRARRKAIDEAAKDDLAPARARLGTDPGPVAAALLLTLRAADVDLVGPRGLPKTALRRAARAAGLSFDDAELLASLARGAGLAGSGVHLGDLGDLLSSTWHAGGAWDEARRPRDRARAGERLGRVPTPTPALRDAVLDVLRALPRGRFARRETVLRAALRDLRVLGAERTLDGVVGREGEAFAGDPAAIVEEILDASLPALGVLDVGEGDEGPVLRPNRAFFRWLAEPRAGAERPDPGSPDAPVGDFAPDQEPRGRWREDTRLDVPPTAPMRSLLAVAPAVTAVASDGRLVLGVEAGSLATGLDRGLDPDSWLEQLTRVGGVPVPAPVAALVRSLHADRTPCQWVAAAAFLDVPDPDLRARLAADHPKLFLDRSPPTGLLVRPGVTPLRVRRALDRAGARLDADAGVPREIDKKR